MKQAALIHARRALDRARRAQERLRQAEGEDAAEEAWDHFLNAASRVYEKLKAGARGNPKSWGWYRKVQDLRRDDPLLQYVHQARNSDHHRFDEVVERIPGGIGIGASGGGIYIKRLAFGPDGVVQADWSPANPGAQLVISQIAPRLDAVDVTNLGVTYKIPEHHLGNKLPDRAILTIAGLTIGYLESLVEDASSLLR